MGAKIVLITRVWALYTESLIKHIGKTLKTKMGAGVVDFFNRALLFIGLKDYFNTWDTGCKMRLSNMLQTDAD